MNVAFWDNQLNERGTSLGLYNYAYYNQTLLGNKSYVFYLKNNPENKEKVIKKFQKDMVVHGVNEFSEVDDYLLKYKIGHIFIIKHGKIDDKISKVAKNCIQCVFECNQPHGELYCSISKWVNGNGGKHPVIPRIITLPDHNKDMREVLRIPSDAVVFGGYGGSTNFNIKLVHDVVYRVAENNPNIYFLFANFNRFCPELPNIIHLPMIIDPDDKVEFINTCDAMLWARRDGETFGQAVAEFSIKNKPIIVTKIGDQAHLRQLRAKSIHYNRRDDGSNLEEILLSFDPKIEREKDWNAYGEFTPKKVMKIFKKLFLDL